MIALAACCLTAGSLAGGCAWRSASEKAAFPKPGVGRPRPDTTAAPALAPAPDRSARAPRDAAPAIADSRVCFVPEYDGGPSCTARIAYAIAAAKQSILVQAYGFTSVPITDALVAAHSRGIDVRVILDKSNLRRGYSAASVLERAGVPVLIDSAHAIAHNKVMVIDGRTVITGSFNFTKSAEFRDAENVLIIEDPSLAAEYARNWHDHAGHSQPTP
jgi:phosphatidylserine/phosphatidylglycerophosphate/cardiolipin synthase-like enzyme